MSELRRWSEEGATRDEIALLAGLRGERAPARARARALRALGLAAGVTTVGTTASVAAATKPGMTLASKILILSLVGGGVVAGGFAVRAARRAAEPPTTAAATLASASPPRVEPGTAMEPGGREASRAPVLPALEPTAAVPVSTAHEGPPVRQARPASSSDQLAREVRALELAHRALTEHDPRAALARLDRYRARFPGGSLSSEAAVLRAQALLASGDRAGAQALADSYSAAHPDSPYASRLKEIVRGE